MPISTGSIVNHVSEFTRKAEPVLNEIPFRLHDEIVLHFDETGTSVSSQKHWLHTASSAQVTYITVHPKRGQVGTDDNDGVLAEFGVWRFMIVGNHILSMGIVCMCCVMCICYVSYRCG
jgi:transposase